MLAVVKKNISKINLRFSSFEGGAEGGPHRERHEACVFKNQPDN